MAEVDIGDETYEAFADLEFADIYLAADAQLGPIWAEFDDDGRGQFIVTAFRVLKRQPWKDGVPSIEAAPEVVKEATAEFAGAIAAGYDLGTPAAGVLAVKRQKAGSVEVEYFRDLDNPAYKPPPLPLPVWDLIRPLLNVPSDAPANFPLSLGFGTGGDSITDASRVYEGSRYFGFGAGDRDYN